MPQSHLEELSRRLAEHEAGATDVRPWAEVEAELRAELAHRRASR
ncbi:MAG: addiction module protein [Polyangiaceae bacterium]|nr:addiction module protein [Polyangiaceae bacterium]